jgi:hypothetical protein
MADPVNITVPRGATWRGRITVTDTETGQLVDLPGLGYTGSFVVSGVTELDLVPALSAGAVDLVLTDEQTGAMLAGVGFWSASVTSSAGEVVRLFRGTVTTE